MKKVRTIGDIWELPISIETEMKGVDYASKSLPWTFNRMGIKAHAWTWYYRMMKINVGVMVQETLLTKLRLSGAKIDKEWKNYRTEDTFDLVTSDGIKIDVKSLNYYPEYDGKIRPKFSLEYLIKKRSYSGEKWAKFFPWLIPRGQVKRDDLFIFALLSSPNYMSKKLGDRNKNFLITSPPAIWGDFFNNKKIILAREKQTKGLDLKFKLIKNSNLTNDSVRFWIGFEKAGKFLERKIILQNGKSKTIKNTSSLAYVRVGKTDMPLFTGELVVSYKNHLCSSVISGGKFRDLNQPPSEPYWRIKRSMFADLFLPKPATLYFIGWIERNEFQKRREKYPSYAHPVDLNDKTVNQLGRSDEAGLMFTRSCCYIYPNVFRGGLKNRNYYVLTKDLNRMADLKDVLNN